MSTLNLTDPRLYEKVRRPLLEAETLPRECFSSPEFYELEIERIFMKVWIFIGRVDGIPTPGDYMVFEHLGGGPIIVLRDMDGGLRAFANACRHRGSQLLSGKGNCGRDIICPYHGWCYGLDGTNIGMPSISSSCLQRFMRRERPAAGTIANTLGASLGISGVHLVDAALVEQSVIQMAQRMVRPHVDSVRVVGS